MHELGHWKMSHVFKHLVVMQTNIFLIFLIFSKFYKTKVLYEAFGFSNEQPVLIGLIIILQCILIPYNEFISFLTTVMTRKFEFDADRFAAERNHGDNLSNALVKLTEDNLGYPYHDYLFSMWHHSHPTLLQRLEAIKLIKRKKE
ncbi:hypothetical protein SNEBB_007402 [Seison nebaliae]|nr:hypothetical protein SNEBB_007402 [Seison nebaliae]